MKLNKHIIKLIDVSTRSKRRRATLFAIGLLQHIRDAEAVDIECSPDVLQRGDVFTEAEFSYDAIADAIIRLDDAY